MDVLSAVAAMADKWKHGFGSSCTENRPLEWAAPSRGQQEEVSLFNGMRLSHHHPGANDYGPSIPLTTP
jgi:hypothetical protein